MADEFVNEMFCTVVFDEFFFTSIGQENVVRHLTKLVWYVHHKLPAARLDTLMKALQPNPQSPEVMHQVRHEKVVVKDQTLNFFFFMRSTSNWSRELNLTK